MIGDTPLTTARVAVIALAGAGAITAFGVFVSVQAATLMLAGLAFVGAAVRLALPAQQAFSVRRRTVDVTTMCLFGVVLAYLGLTTPLG